MLRIAIDSVVWLGLAARAGAVDSAVRESERSFSGWVVEAVFSSPQSAHEFARRAAVVVGYSVSVRRYPAVVSSGWVAYTQPWYCSVPCAAPGRELSLGWASRGSRAVIS
jgi:hypothetical protein